MFASSVRELSRLWSGSLSHYRRHQNDEHLEALLAESLRYTGLHLENDLCTSAYWSKAPLARRVSLLLFLVDRGVVSRVKRQGRSTFEVGDHATNWVISQPSMVAYLVPVLEFVAALQSEKARRVRPASN